MLKNLFIDHNRISYFDRNENLSRAIIFIHGNSQCHRSFDRQFSSPELQSFRLIAINLPGHGDSSAMESYSLPVLGKVLRDFISALGISKYILAGHSLGGHVAIESLEFLNPTGLLIVGTPPATKPLAAGMFLPHPAMELLYKNDLSDSEIQTLLQAIGSGDIEQFKNTDPAFRGLFAESLSQSLLNDEVMLLKNYLGPKKIVLGNKDPLVNREYFQKIGHQLVMIDGGHSPHFENADSFNIVISDFAHQVLQMDDNHER